MCHFKVPLHPGLQLLRCAGTLRCWIVHVQAIIVKRELHSISRVPREPGEETNLARAGSVEFVVSVELDAPAVAMEWNCRARQNI
jgi:hypothetical protein